MEIQRTAELDLNELKFFFDSVESLFPKQMESEDHFEFINPNDLSEFNSSFLRLYEKDFKSGCEINIWDISGIKRDEVRNCAVLAWWLDHNESHGLGNILLKQIVVDYLNGFIDSKHIANNYRCGVEKLPLGMIQDRIDIEIVSSEFLLFWEVKIDAKEGDRQLERYCELINKKANKTMDRAVIYLTPYSVPFDKREHDGNVCYLTWSDIKKSFLTVCDSLNENDLGISLLNQYCDFISEF